MKICYIDTETTGVDSRRNGIIQLAAIMEIDGVVVSEFEIKIKPWERCEISDEALAVSGTTREDLEKFEPEATAYRDFINWLGRFINKWSKTDKAFFAGYNAKFDEEFVRAFFLRNGDKYYGSWFWSGTLDVMAFSLWRLASTRPTMANFKLGTVADKVLGENRVQEIVKAEGLHNALADIRLTRELFQVVV